MDHVNADFASLDQGKHRPPLQGVVSGGVVRGFLKLRGWRARIPGRPEQQTQVLIPATPNQFGTGRPLYALYSFRRRNAMRLANRALFAALTILVLLAAANAQTPRLE